MSREREPEPLVYRFTVKTDRDGNKAIEKMAKNAGVSATALVQWHFETLLKANGAPIAEAKTPPVPPAPKPPARVKPNALLLEQMRAAADKNGKVALSLADLAARCGGYSATWASLQVAELVRRKLIAVERKGHKQIPTVYRLLEAPPA